MSEPGDSTRRHNELQLHEICVQGHLDAARLANWMDDLTVKHNAGGTTTLICPPLDQTALHGLLARIRDLGLPIVSIQRVSTPEEEGTV